MKRGEDGSGGGRREGGRVGSIEVEALRRVQEKEEESAEEKHILHQWCSDWAWHCAVPRCGLSNEPSEARLYLGPGESRRPPLPAVCSLVDWLLACWLAGWLDIDLSGLENIIILSNSQKYNRGHDPCGGGCTTGLNSTSATFSSPLLSPYISGVPSRRGCYHPDTDGPQIRFIKATPRGPTVTRALGVTNRRAVPQTLL
ncbi:unnamed protein product [Pleuronectes platessa]|uniref:Uncharacterized protein n=1 Tax=Pleuronectes platessa TaxID=8262 RepID=A0A9N7Y6R3_PLEPL|nr:unnamed protein product [Pleuronectes platessa]